VALDWELGLALLGTVWELVDTAWELEEKSPVEVHEYEYE